MLDKLIELDYFISVRQIHGVRQVQWARQVHCVRGLLFIVSDRFIMSEMFIIIDRFIMSGRFIVSGMFFLCHTSSLNKMFCKTKNVDIIGSSKLKSSQSWPHETYDMFIITDRFITCYLRQLHYIRQVYMAHRFIVSGRAGNSHYCSECKGSIGTHTHTIAQNVKVLLELTLLLRM